MCHTSQHKPCPGWCYRHRILICFIFPPIFSLLRPSPLGSAPSNSALASVVLSLSSPLLLSFRELNPQTGSRAPGRVGAVIVATTNYAIHRAVFTLNTCAPFLRSVGFSIVHNHIRVNRCHRGPGDATIDALLDPLLIQQ